MVTVLKIIAIGIGATLTMDIWAYILSIFNIKSLDYRLVGRWIGSMTKGKFKHDKIIHTTPFPNESLIGWIAHYFIGIAFVFLLVLIYGTEWIENPTLQPALFIGLLTTIAPFFLMQPSFGFGIAGSKLPEPNIARLKSIITHFIYGLGIYIASLGSSKLTEFL
ncbi:DUF2938 domain-containing protein [Flavobacterium sp. NRK F10]|uniref:DUF2938 domain-containing protein n=1 Tax=Flavobacterium sediminis TaxID=2201181 RepID=A0A2U8QY45_9FLAO|nr:MULTISPECIES: DUF2938 domain-containing protein [Flavobacterium]AWM14735.1 DUF2938 domain-containing protein [Flavobacterium sediminis]MCO6175976.1 DUF2938 domain-containing protein [Flavobacterium sp. NRK F10]